jgi:hypothetical protein
MVYYYYEHLNFPGNKSEVAKEEEASEVTIVESVKPDVPKVEAAKPEVAVIEVEAEDDDVLELEDEHTKQEIESESEIKEDGNTEDNVDDK